MTVPSFVIEETTGQQRMVSLAGRALPYQGVSWGGRQRTKKTWYPGNPVATMQVLGPEETTTRLSGMWKDRFIGQTGFVHVRGFDTVRLAEDLVRIFESLRRSGNELRVQWGAQVRFGVLVDFEPRYIRPEDVEWQAEFEWLGVDSVAPRAAAAPLRDQRVRQALQDLDDDFVFDPPTILPDYRAQVTSSLAALRVQTGIMFDRLRQAAATVSLPLDVVQGLVAAADKIRTEAEDLKGRLADQVYTYAQTTDQVSTVLACAAWRGNVSVRTGALRSTALRQAKELEARARPGALAVVVVRGDTTLRQLALVYYGSADQWQQIADVNGFDSSVVPAGTVVVIPPKPTSGPVARV